jgi:hypothetical protein
MSMIPLLLMSQPHILNQSTLLCLQMQHPANEEDENLDDKDENLDN